MTYAMLDIMNAALISQGQYEVAENDGTDEFRLLSRNWATIVDAELEDGNYHFTKKQTNLLTRTDGSFGFEDAYVLPGDVLHVRQAWTEDDSGVRTILDAWAQDGTKVYCNEDAGIFIEYTHSADPSIWSANFAKGVQAKLEAVILRAIKEEAGEALRMEEAAENYFQRARTNSSRSRSMDEPFLRGRVASARFRRRG